MCSYCWCGLFNLNERSWFSEAFSAPVFQNGPDRNAFNVGLSRNLQQVLERIKSSGLFQCSQGELMSERMRERIKLINITLKTFIMLQRFQINAVLLCFLFIKESKNQTDKII